MSTTSPPPLTEGSPSYAEANAPALDEQLIQETRNQIRELVQEITQLAQADLSLDEFFAEFLNRILTALVAEGGVVWLPRDDGTLAARYRVAGEALITFEEHSERHRLLLQRILQGGQALAAPPRSGFPEDQLAGNPTDHLLLCAPIIMEQEAYGVLEIWQRPGAGPTTQRGYLRFLSQMSELASGFLKNHRLKQYAEREQVWQKLDQFLSQLHRSLDLPATSYAVVNEARLFLECDRVSLALPRHGHTEIVAVSGLDQLDRRADQLRWLAELSRAVLATGEPFWSTTNSVDMAPQIEHPWQQYVDRSHVKALAVLPIQVEHSDEPAETIAALIVENITSAQWPATLPNRLKIVLHYAAPALDHALTYAAIPWRSFTHLVPKTNRHSLLIQHWKLIGMLSVALLLGLTFFIPWPMVVAARGKVVPRLQWDIFAPDTGTVVSVPVRHGQVVQPGDLLVELSSDELDLQITNLQGRLRIAHEELQSHRRALLENSRGGQPTLSASEENRLTGETQRLEQTLLELQQELDLLSLKQQRLQVRAEHAGEVVTWQVERQLQRRPVQTGQVLMTICDTQGPWELELQLPERRLHTLDTAHRPHEQQPVKVDFVLSSLPGREFQGIVQEIERVAQASDGEGNTLLVRVAMAEEQNLPPLRSDTTATAKIHCGQASFGYVCFGDVWEAFYKHVLFWW